MRVRSITVVESNGAAQRVLVPPQGGPAAALSTVRPGGTCRARCLRSVLDVAGSRAGGRPRMTAGVEGLAAWPPAAVATVVAAALAVALTAVAGLVGGLWAVLRSRRDVAREERDRAWSRFVWTVDQACDGDVGRGEVGLASADAMYDMQILRERDAVLGTMVLELITGRRSR